MTRYKARHSTKISSRTYKVGRSGAIVVRMNDDDMAAIRGTAVVDQLKAEIGASPLSTKSLAAEIGVDYSTMRNYLAGKRQITLGVLLRALGALDVAPDVFISRAMTRAND